MSLLFMAASLAALLAATLLVVRIVRPGGPVDALLLAWLVATAGVVLQAELLATVDLLARPLGWCLGSAGMLALTLPAAALRGGCFRRPIVSFPVRDWRAGFRALAPAQRVVLGVLAAAAAVTSGMNLLLAVAVAPHNWDSMTYHLARVAYFIQHGNFDRFGTNYWAQEVHPRVASALLIYAHLVTGGRENLFQLVQFAAYAVSAMAVYGIARRNGERRSGGLFACFVFSLLTEVLLQSITTQNDLLGASYFGVVVYFLLSARARGSLRHLAIAGLALGMMLGVKASTLLALPSVAVVVVYAIGVAGVPRWAGSRARRALCFGGASLLGLALLAAPAGYLQNQRRFHNPIGPLSVRRAHSYAGLPAADVLRAGTKNVVRYGIEFVSLDGLVGCEPAIRVQRALRWLPDRASRLAGVDLGADDGVRGTFVVGRAPTAHEDFSYWGVFGFALIWPVVGLYLAGVLKGSSQRALAAAAVVFVLAQSYSSPYDRWRGRYFLLAAVLAAPLIASRLEEWSRGWRGGYLKVVVAVGALSGVWAVAFRENHVFVEWPPVTQGEPSVFRRDRLAQLMAGRPSTLPAMRRFEAAVPPDAVVAAALPPDAYEYPMFGEGLTRRIEPVNVRRMNVSARARFLLFSSRLLPPTPGDQPLGDGLFLRRY